MSSLPTVFVAFGVTGDLMRQKILPELFILHTKDELPVGCTIVGVSRKEWGDTQLREYIRSVIPHASDDFLLRFSFVQGDAGEDAVFEKLADIINGQEALLYIALSPQLYKHVCERLVRSPLIKQHEKLRLMIEKPFGTNESEAQALTTILHTAFSESHIYRVDHYLAKESLLKLPVIEIERIKSITLSFLQTEGVEKRIAFYESTGALRDVGQNHMMEMLTALLGRNNREAVLRDLHVFASKEEVAMHTKRGQASIYSSIPGVSPHSQIETYFKIETRWRTIPLTLEAGKYIPIEKKDITVVYTDGTVVCFPIENNIERKEHERLILACLRSEHQSFMSQEEVMAQWHFVEPILEFWATSERAIPILPTHNGVLHNS